MGRARKYTIFNKTRLVLFTHSYACYAITYYIKTRYKINDKLTPIELRKKYFNKRIIPEISWGGIALIAIIVLAVISSAGKSGTNQSSNSGSSNTDTASNNQSN